MAGGFVFLVMNGHEKPAYVLLGAGVLNVIGGFLRARLTDGNREKSDKECAAGWIKMNLDAIEQP